MHHYSLCVIEMSIEIIMTLNYKIIIIFTKKFNLLKNQLLYLNLIYKCSNDRNFIDYVLISVLLEKRYLQKLVRCGRIYIQKCVILFNYFQPKVQTTFKFCGGLSFARNVKWII
jgi:hypothetical protein